MLQSPLDVVKPHAEYIYYNKTILNETEKQKDCSVKFKQYTYESQGFC